MMRQGIIGILLLINTVLFAAENKTKLVVGITISNFYPEWLAIYGNDLSEGGLKRITAQGKEISADYDYLYSQTGVDQATIYSGLLPSEHGVISHEWYDRLRKKRQSNVVSDHFNLIGGEIGKGLSPDWLQALTLGCAMKMNNAFSKIYSISINGEEAVMSGGSCANMAIWLSEKNGRWMSSDYYADSLPGWLNAYNAKMESDFFIRRGWMSLADESGNTTALRLKNKVGLGNGFFYDLVQAKRKYNTYRILKATPYANTMVADLSQELIKSEQLGRDNDPDLLALNFSCLDYMNRDFEVGSREFQDVVMRLDRDVEKLLNELDTRVGRGNYTVFLTFSEARELLPEELGKMRLSAGYFSIFKAVALLKSYLSLIYGDGDWVLDYDSEQIYLDRELIDKKKISLKEMQDKIADFMIEFEGVARVITAHSLTHNVSSSGVEVLYQNSFSQKRSGDVLYSLLPTWIPELKDPEDNYARYSKRHKVPLYLYGAGLPVSLSSTCSMSALLSILCKILNIPVPYTSVK
ncbi:MAG: alkaline phosphatase family protein [Odoribacter sp.]